MTRPLRVFIVSGSDDIGGVAIAIQRAFERHGGDWEVVSMRGTNNYIDYPVDQSWDPELFHEMWAWADVIHSMEQTHNLTGLYNPPGKPILLHHHGQAYRWNKAALDAVMEAHNLVTICSTIDMEWEKVEWLPNPVDTKLMRAIRAQYQPGNHRTKVRFVHSPTAFREAKGTTKWQAAVKKVGGELKLTEGKSWAQNLADKATGDVQLDQLMHGYGNSGLEAMGMAMPVVSGASPEIEEQIIARVGYLPYHPAMGRVDEAVSEICEVDLQGQVAERGWQYINDYHAQERVVGKLQRLYTEAMERYDPAELAWTDGS